MKGEMTNNLTEKKITREYYKQWNANRLDNLDEMENSQKT